MILRFQSKISKIVMMSFSNRETRNLNQIIMVTSTFNVQYTTTYLLVISSVLGKYFSVKSRFVCE